MIEVGLLEAIPPFSEISPRAREELAAAAVALSFGPDQVIHREGDVCDRVAVLLAGEIRVAKTSPTGREIELYRISAHQSCMLEVASAMSDQPYPAGAVTTVQGEAISIPTELFMRLAREEPAMSRFAFGLLSDRLAVVIALVEEVAFHRLDERVARLLAREANANGLVPLTHEQIAERLGTVREVVSRILSNLAHARVIELERGGVRVLDRDRLTSPVT